MTLLEFLREHYAPGRLNLSAKAEEQLAVAVRRLNAHAGHAVTLNELSAGLLGGWLKSLSLAGQSAATINGKRGSILCLWKAAYRAGKSKRPPEAFEVPSKRETRKIPNSWTVAEMERILEACRAIPGTFRFSGISKANFLTSLVLFQYETGTRLAASLSVRTADVDLQTGRVVLQAEDAKTGLEQVHWLSVETTDAIASHWDPSRKLVWPFGPNRHSLWQSLRSVLKAAGLQSDRRSLFHRFRRTTATLLTARAGVAVASAALGHTSEAMTLRVYVDPTNVPTIKPIDVLPRLMSR